VRWYVAADPSEASEEQIKKLRQMVVGGNAGAIQPLNERTVFERD
jgi:carbonic anhydrase